MLEPVTQVLQYVKVGAIEMKEYTRVACVNGTTQGNYQGEH